MAVKFYHPVVFAARCDGGSPRVSCCRLFKATGEGLPFEFSANWSRRHESNPSRPGSKHLVCIREARTDMHENALIRVPVAVRNQTPTKQGNKNPAHSLDGSASRPRCRTVAVCGAGDSLSGCTAGEGREMRSSRLPTQTTNAYGRRADPLRLGSKHRPTSDSQ